MVIKKTMLALFFLTFFAFVSAGTITYVKVPAIVPLDEYLTIYGTTTDANTSVLCSFRLFDDTNVLVIRLSDEYVFVDGSFSSEYKITEPLFARGLTYRVNVNCNGASSDAYFVAGQKTTFYGMNPQTILNDVEWWTDGTNSFVAVVYMVLIIVLIGCIYYIFKQI